MIELICWNIQWGRGADGVVDLRRIVDAVFAMGDPQLVCLQEVARYFPDLDGGEGADQVAVLQSLLPEFEAVYGATTELAGDRRGQRKQFGNLLLSRAPVLQVYRHLFPRPAEETACCAQKGALEVIVATGSGALRVVNTHLEYHSEAHRMVQVERLRGLHREACAHPRVHPGLLDRNDGPTVPPVGPHPGVLCGDFNMIPTDVPYAELLAPFDDGTPSLYDAWTIAHPGAVHPATCGVYERVYWDGPNCRDFCFLTAAAAQTRIELEVDGVTAASDHQPVRLVLDL